MAFLHLYIKRDEVTAASEPDLSSDGHRVWQVTHVPSWHSFPPAARTLFRGLAECDQLAASLLFAWPSLCSVSEAGA